jgi:amino acid adenylation domain-containing protein
MSGLHEYLRHSARNSPDKVAVEDGDRRITYTQLETLSNWLAGKLNALGVVPGDRVGIYLPKSIDAIIAMHGAMKAGAAYVPVDPSAPATRNSFIHHDCTVRVAIVYARFEHEYRAGFADLGDLPRLLIVPEAVDEPGLQALSKVDTTHRQAVTADTGPADLAYILYTSGSTGKPKGVMLTHGNATSFVDWCSETFMPTADDRCSSHAPFHFDLSVLDIYMSLKHGCTLVLIPEDIGKEPVRLAPFIAGRRLSIWYSAPSILGMLAQFGKLPQHDLSRLRLILFAGEVFPVKHLRTLKQLVPHPDYYNLYGPTETNVCTYLKIPSLIPDDRDTPYPIGWTCSHLEAKAVDEHGVLVLMGAEGELVVRGPAVTQGYWNLPQRNEQAFLVDDSGKSWYRTGDIVKEDPEDGYIYLGRRDRMIKKRGYRIELGEIEACLYGHPKIKEVGAVAHSGADGELKVVAFISTTNGARLSTIALKQYCAQRLPLYMVPDLFHQRPTLPRTSTDKVDYQQLLQLLVN